MQTSLKFGKLFSFSTSLGLSYHITTHKYIGVFLNSSIKNNKFVSNCLVFNIHLYGYNIKFPIFIGTNLEENPSLLTNIAFIIAANLTAFGIMKLSTIKSTKKV